MRKWPYNNQVEPEEQTDASHLAIHLAMTDQNISNSFINNIIHHLDVFLHALDEQDATPWPRSRFRSDANY